jgi:hypothetical protein
LQAPCGLSQQIVNDTSVDVGESKIATCEPEVGLVWSMPKPYEWQEHDAKAPKFDAVLRTTWNELAERELVKPRSFDRYELTGPGWIAGLRITGAFDNDEFLRKTGKVGKRRQDEDRHAAMFRAAAPLCVRTPPATGVLPPFLGVR